MLLDLSDDKSTLTAPSLYLDQYWPIYMSPYGITRPQWVNTLRSEQNGIHSADGIFKDIYFTWWHHQMETFSALLGNSLVTGEFPSQRPVTWSFDVLFDLHLNKQLSKQSWGWWFEMPSRPLWHHHNVIFFVKNIFLLWLKFLWN